MDRREFLAASAGAIAGAAFTPAQVSTAPPRSPALHTRRQLRMVCAYPSAPAGTFDTAHGIAVRLESIIGAGYRINLETCCTGSIAAFEAGAAEIVFATEAANARRLPALAATTGLPGAFAQNPEDARDWLTGAGGRLWHHMHDATGLQPLYAGPEGSLPSLWSRRPIESFSGLKVASIAPLRGEVLKGLGADLIALAPSDFAGALASGEIDAVEVVSQADALALGVARIARFCLEGAVAAHAGSHALTFNPALWGSFTPATRAAVTALANTFPSQVFSKTAANELALKAAVQTALGVTYSRAGERVQAAVDRLSEAVIADFESRYSKTVAPVALPWRYPLLTGKQIAIQRIA